MSFHSASVRIVKSERAVAECLDLAFPNGLPADIRLFMVNSALGHQLDELAAALGKMAPGIPMVGGSCSGVIGREGVGESMSEVALMAISGPPAELALAGVKDVYGHNADQKGLELARGLKNQAPDLTTIYLLCPGIDMANDLILKALVEAFGEGVNIFGGTSSDNRRGLVNYQYYGDEMGQHLAWAVGLADPSLKSVSRATHGFSAYGSPMVATRVESHKIYEFYGRPAWAEYTKRLSLPSSANCGDTIAIGALAEKVPEQWPEMPLSQEYGSPYLLRLITKVDADGAMYYPVTCREGLRVWLSRRNEDLIFKGLKSSLEYISDRMGGRKPVAVFQADCLDQGRLLFNRVVKDEIIAMMHSYFSDKDKKPPPWLGMYGFGEYARLGGRNMYHSCSTALLTLYRD